MKRSAKNYICIFITLAALYFTGVSVLKAHELHAFADESGQKVSSSVNNWYAAASVEGMIGISSLCWFFLSDQNRKSVKETLASPVGKGVLLGGAFLGLTGGYAISTGTFGNIGKLDLPASEVVTAPAADPDSSSEEETVPEKEVPITADTFPVDETAEERHRQEEEEAKGIHADGTTVIKDVQDLSDYYQSTESDMSSLVVKKGGQVTLMGLVEKSGDAADGAAAMRTGMNAAVFVEEGGSLALRGGSINTSGSGNPALSVQGGTASVSDSTITTTSKDSEIIYAGAGGSVNGNGLTANTSGNESPILYTGSDGTIKLDSCVFTTTGTTSPVAMGSGTFTLNNCGATLGTTPAAILNGSGSLKYDFSSITSKGASGIFQVQKTDETTKEDKASIELTGTYISVTSSDTASTAPLLRIDNAKASCSLNGNIVTLPSLKIADVIKGSLDLSLDAQTIEGKIILDKDSTVNIDLKNGAVLSSAINSENSDGTVDLHLDASSTLYLTGDCHVSSLSNDFGSNDNISFNGFTIYVAGKPVTY